MAVRALSACLITLDEEANLEACLASLSFCAEVVVVDCGSRDRTVAIARARGARVIETDWPGMIAQKNRAVAAAAHDWVLCIDADERISPVLAASILRALDTSAEADAVGYAFAWETVYAGGAVRSDRGRGRWKLRLFDRRHGSWGGRDPHGHVTVDGPTERLRGLLHHYGTRDLGHWVTKLNAYTEAGARALLAERRSPLVGMTVRAPWAFFRTFVLRGGFRDGSRGFVVAVQAWAYVFVRSARLYELRRRPSSASSASSSKSTSSPSDADSA